MEKNNSARNMVFAGLILYVLLTFSSEHRVSSYKNKSNEYMKQRDSIAVELGKCRRSEELKKNKSDVDETEEPKGKTYYVEDVDFVSL